MELVPFIYIALIAGVFLLVFVIVVTFMATKTNEEKRLMHGQDLIGELKYKSPPRILSETNLRANRSNAFRQKNYQAQIYPINNYQREKELNIVRKPSYTQTDFNDRYESNYSYRSRKIAAHSNRQRYTIVNDDQKNITSFDIMGLGR